MASLIEKFFPSLFTGKNRSFVFISVDSWVCCCCCSVAKLCPVLSLGLQHARLPCPSPPPRVCSDSCPLNPQCHPTISSSGWEDEPPASFAFHLSQHQGLFQWAGSLHQVAKVLPMNIQGWFPLGLTGLISLLSKRLLRVFSSTTVQKHQVFSAQSSSWSNSHIGTWQTGNHNFDYMDLCQWSLILI